MACKRREGMEIGGETSLKNNASELQNAERSQTSPGVKGAQDCPVFSRGTGRIPVQHPGWPVAKVHARPRPHCPAVRC